MSLAGVDQTTDVEGGDLVGGYSEILSGGGLLLVGEGEVAAMDS
jgi:hypothetical protein